jgi:hypothetical protein
VNKEAQMPTENGDLLIGEKALVDRIDEELLVEGDPTKRMWLKLQKISLEYELMKEKENGYESFSNVLERGLGSYCQSRPDP